MSIKASNKARTLDDKYTEMMWKDLVELITSEYPSYKIATETVIRMGVKNANEVEIEIYPKYHINLHKFSIKVWIKSSSNIPGYDKYVDGIETNTLQSTLTRIDHLLKYIPTIKKTQGLHKGFIKENPYFSI